MLPAVVVSQVRDALLDYLRTAFRLRDAVLEAALLRFLTDPDQGLFRGPYLDVQLPFRKADPDGDLPLDLRPSFTPFPHPRLRSRLHLLHPRSHLCHRARCRGCSRLSSRLRRRGPSSRSRSSIPRCSASHPGGDCRRRRAVRAIAVRRVGRDDETLLGLRRPGVPEVLAQDDGARDDLLPNWLDDGSGPFFARAG
jgi:hypothetical protein